MVYKEGESRKWIKMLPGNHSSSSSLASSSWLGKNNFFLGVRSSGVELQFLNSNGLFF
jgi:hypothetical protein